MTNPSHSRGLSRKHVRHFPKSVGDALLNVTDQGVRHRIIDGDHILLYPVDGTSRPFKVSAHRPAPKSLQFIRDFCQSNHLEEP